MTFSTTTYNNSSRIEEEGEESLNPLLPVHVSSTVKDKDNEMTNRLEFESLSNTKKSSMTALQVEPINNNNYLNTSGSSTTTTMSHDTRWQVATYMLIFFFMMIGHEVALEAASTSFNHLESLASTVTLFQFGFCFLLPLITSTKEVCRTFPKTWKSALPYVQLSVLVFGATGLATQSLKYVSYPTKVVFKSAKLIPTMIVSTFIFQSNNKYGPLDYFAAFLLCLGAAGYSYNSTSNGSGDDDSTSMYGISLLTISIICDAIVPNLQQRLMTASNFVINNAKDHDEEYAVGRTETGTGLSAQAVMVNTNAIGFGIILIYMVLSGSLMNAFSTAVADPRLLLYLVCVGVGISTAVLAYTKLIHATGSVVAVAVSTLRKVATVLLSYILFPKPLLSIHVFSGLLVLIGVLIATFGRKPR